LWRGPQEPTAVVRQAVTVGLRSVNATQGFVESRAI
jgi:hypothetical protein